MYFFSFDATILVNKDVYNRVSKLLYILEVVIRGKCQG